MKKISLLVLTLLLVFTTGCAKEFKCDMCGEMKKSKVHESTVLGEKVEMCDDCYKELKEIKDTFK